MGQFASASPTLYMPARKAGILLLRVQSMAAGRMWALRFVVAVA